MWLWCNSVHFVRPPARLLYVACIAVMLVIERASTQQYGEWHWRVPPADMENFGEVGWLIGIFLISAGVDSLQLTNMNSTLDNVSSSVGVHQKRSLIYVLDRPRTLRCILVAETPHDVKIFIGQRELTTQFDRGQTVVVSGRPGLRRMQYTIQLTNHLFQPQASDHSKKIKCSAYSQDGGTINTTSVRLIIHCELKMYLDYIYYWWSLSLRLHLIS